MRHRSSLALPALPRQAPARLSQQHSAPPTKGPRVLVVLLSSFRLERCGWQADEPVVLLAEERNALRIQAMTLAAATAGLQRGMSISQARALVPDIGVELLADPEEEKQDLLSLAHLLQCLGPESHPLGADAVAVRVEGSAPRLGGEPALLLKAHRLLQELGHHARSAIADTRHVALALARSASEHRGPDHIVPPGGSAQALESISLSNLRPSLSLQQVLASVGVRCFGQLARLPASAVATRFGLEGLSLWRTARGQAVDARPPPPPSVNSALVFRRQLPSPIDQMQAVVFTLNQLAARLQAALGALDQAALRVQIRLSLERAPDHLLPLRLGQPRRAARDLMLLIRRRLEGLTLSDRVVDISLEVLETCPFVGRQQALLDARGAREPLTDVLARLTDTLGESAVFSPELVDAHRPEHGWSAQTWSPRRRGAVGELPWGETLRSDRPTLLLRGPLPIRCKLSPSGAQLSELQIEQRWVPVRRQSASERLQGGWWTESPYDRDYRRVILADGRQAWIFQETEQGSQCWWLQGWWD